MSEKDLKEFIKKAEEIGLDMENKAGTFLLVNDDSKISSIDEKHRNNFVIMDIRDAIVKFPWVKNYMWKLVDKDKDEYTKITQESLGGGYFIWVKKNAHVDIPIQSCLMLSKEGFKQRVHNIIIAEEGSRANIISGCVQDHGIKSSTHIGISEFFIQNGAYLNFTMIHHWGQETFVRPRTGAVVEEDGNFVSNYILLQPVKDIQAYPFARLVGDRSRATFTSLVNARGRSHIDMGSRIELKGKESKGEIISRVIMHDEAVNISRGLISGDDKSCKGHLECRGLVLSDDSKMHAIPELVATKEGAELSHEAAVGKIAESEIQYLMARGLSRDEATSVIVRGFLDINILGLPPKFKKKIENLMELAEEGD